MAQINKPDEYFNTVLYTGNGTTGHAITGVGHQPDFVWIKNRDAADSNVLTDTVRGATKILHSDTTAAEATDADTITAFSSTGFALGDDVKVNTNNESYCAWTFKKAPKFFDVVTYTGTGSARTVAHSLGGTVGMILIKNLGQTDNWAVYHRANTAAPQTDYLILNTNAATADSADWWNDTAPTTSVFTVGTDHAVNADGESYVAYVFAHETGSDSMIQCGSYTGNGNATGPSIDLGWEPQWLLTKAATRTSDWSIVDSMRGVHTGGVDQRLHPQSSEAEPAAATHSVDMIDFNAEGFNVTNSGTIVNGNTETYIYVAIRRPNMKTHTDATEVFAIDAGNGGSAPDFTSGFPVDFAFQKEIASGDEFQVHSRLQGPSKALSFDSNNAEDALGGADIKFDLMTGYYGAGKGSGYYAYMWKRAKGYFDVVLYTGNDGVNTLNHSLGAVPEMIWFKCRNNARNWFVFHKDVGIAAYLELDNNAAEQAFSTMFNSTEPTSTQFTVNTSFGNLNNASYTYISYLFATLAGVSKVGSVTHSGSSTDVDCGFTAGARFVLLKRTDATGGWYIWDSVRGIVAGNDPYFLLDVVTAQVTNTDLIDPLASGFQISGDFTDGDYIFYAIA